MHGWLERSAAAGLRADRRLRPTASTSRLASTAAAPRARRRRARDDLRPALRPRGLHALLSTATCDRCRAWPTSWPTALVAPRSTDVAGDAVEGFNPSHDLCRLVIDAAVVTGSTARRSPRRDDFEFPLEGAPGEWPRRRRRRLPWSSTTAPWRASCAAAATIPSWPPRWSAPLASHGRAAVRPRTPLPVQPCRTSSGRFARPALLRTPMARRGWRPESTAQVLRLRASTSRRWRAVLGRARERRADRCASCSPTTRSPTAPAPSCGSATWHWRCATAATAGGLQPPARRRRRRAAARHGAGGRRPAAGGRAAGDHPRAPSSRDDDGAAAVSRRAGDRLLPWLGAPRGGARRCSRASIVTSPSTTCVASAW